MKNLKRIILLIFTFSGIASAQNLAWKENSSFSMDSSSNSLESDSQLSYLLSYNTLPINETGFVEISNFLIDGQSLTAQSELESISIFLTFEDSFSLSKIYQKSYSITYSTIDINGTIEKSIKIQGPDGEIAKIENINLNSSDTFRIEKTDVNKIILKYNTQEYLITDNYLAEARIAFFSNTEKLAFDLNSDGFWDIDPNPNIVVLDDDRNWISVKTFDNAGLLTSASVDYFNSLGKSEQRQSRDLKTNRTWVDQTFYDSQGRPSLKTFSSPLSGTPQHFEFKEGFLKKWNGDEYTTYDFENNPERPAKASTDLGTVGWYYSNNNTFEPYQDEADNRPYLNTVYDELNPGAVRATVGGKQMDVNDNGNLDGLYDEFPQGYSYTMPAAQELYYVFGKDYFPGEEDPINGKKVVTQFFKTVQIDAQGNESVTFTDKNGKVWASAKSGEGQNFEVVSIIGEQGFVDVHIPKNVNNISFINGTSGYSIYNLRTGESIPSSQITGGNVYRIEATPIPLNSNIYITLSGGIIAPSAKGIRYNVNYSDFSLNYYDKAGHLKETVQPLGFDSSCLSGPIQNTVNHTHKSTYRYNAAGELLSSISPDEGSALFIYRSDGQIRFSRNSEQVSSDEFSYTNYDNKGRPIESGVSTEPNPFFPSIIDIDPTLTAETNVTASSGSLSKSGRSTWTASGFTSSENTGSNNFDISFQFLQDKEGVVGISETNADGDYKTVEYAMYFSDNVISIISNGSFLVKKIAYYSDGDVFHIERNSNTLYFKKNDQIIYQLDAWQANQSTYPTYVIDGALYTNQATVSNITISQLTEVPSTPPSPDNWDVDPNSCKEQTFTLYDVKDTETIQEVLYGSGTGTEIGPGPSTISFRTQHFVEGNVSKTYTKKPETSTTWYSYDIYGRVEWMVQFINGLGAKTIDYYYDDTSGQISKVIYQRDEPSERFVHKYLYNDVDQLLTVETSRDNINFTEHAKYFYYETGELKRVELAEGLQGTDYVYTLDGKLKSINHNSLSSNFDPGQDQNDVFGLRLDYHSKDYTRAGTNIGAGQTGLDRYDGNIKTSWWATEGLNTGGSTNHFSYNYNSYNWLQSATFGTSEFQGNPPIGLPNYSLSNLTYDANGNILSLKRTKDYENGSNLMDNLQYNYITGKNQLEYVTDSSGNNENDGDIKTQSPENYVYNEIGQLVENNQDNIAYNYWTSGLVKSVVNTLSPGKEKEGVYFNYNDRGQRVLKQYINENKLDTRTFYVRDASGQVMAIYNIPPLSGPISVEYPIYGLSRLGMATPGDIFTYELTDHLGNVRAVIRRDTSVEIILLETFSDPLSNFWESTSNVSLLIEDDRLKAKVSNPLNNPNKATVKFPVEAGHTYSGRFIVDLDETVNRLNYNVTSGSGGPSTISKLNFADENGEYTFNFKALDTGYMYLTFSLSQRAISSDNEIYYLDNVKITDITTNDTPIMLAKKDYYPFGMPMPERNDEGAYRYAYQGQEKDPETGMEAFELRLWDARIGRWLTTDPGNQFYSPYLGMGNNPMNGVESRGADWWQLTKDGSLVLIKETSDRFNIFFDSEGVEITRTNAPMQYLKDIEGMTGKNHEFIKLRVGQANLIALAMYNDEDLYNTMLRRAKETHWNSTKVLEEMREAGNLPAKKGTIGALDLFTQAVTFAITKKANVGLNYFQQASLFYRAKDLYGAAFDQSDLQNLQKRIGQDLFNSQQNFMSDYPTRWFFMQQNVPNTNNIGGCKCVNPRQF